MRYWLMKCEPAAYTIDDLKRDKVTSWEGVRNYQARNFLRDRMQVGDPVLFYASNADPSGVTGLAKIARAGYPDQYQWQKGHKYYDPDADRDKPVWYMVDIEFVERFPRDRAARDAEAHEGSRADDGHQEGKPVVRPARKQG